MHRQKNCFIYSGLTELVSKTRPSSSTTAKRSNEEKWRPPDSENWSKDFTLINSESGKINRTDWIIKIFNMLFLAIPSIAAVECNFCRRLLVDYNQNLKKKCISTRRYQFIKTYLNWQLIIFVNVVLCHKIITLFTKKVGTYEEYFVWLFECILLLMLLDTDLIKTNHGWAH